MHERKAFFIGIAVAFLIVWNCPVEGAWQKTTPQEKFLTIEFEEATLPSLAGGEKLTPKTLSTYAASISGVKGAKASDKPVLVYFCVEELEVVPDNLKKLNVKQQLKQCAKLEETCFEGKNVEIGTLAKLFACIKVNLSYVLPSKNRMFNALKAPLVLIVPSDDGMVTLLSGRKVNKSEIVRKMTNVLQRKKVNVSKVLKDTKGILPRLRKLETSKSALNKDLMATQKKVNSAIIDDNSSKAERYKKKQKELQVKFDALEKKLASVYEKFDAALRGSK